MLDEASKPKFVYDVVGCAKQGKPAGAGLDEYLRVDLSASAYRKIIKDSMASEKTNK